jgi:hypothetical protein
MPMHQLDAKPSFYTTLFRYAMGRDLYLHKHARPELSQLEETGRVRLVIPNLGLPSCLAEPTTSLLHQEGDWYTTTSTPSISATQNALNKCVEQTGPGNHQLPSCIV